MGNAQNSFFIENIVCITGVIIFCIFIIVLYNSPNTFDYEKMDEETCLIPGMGWDETIEKCVACKKGYYSSTDMTTCSKCPKGKFSKKAVPEKGPIFDVKNGREQIDQKSKRNGPGGYDHH